jgi:radical SAM-linked protein
LTPICEIEFSITGLLRFLSHLEMQNFFSRLLLKAEVPVRYSQGFDPRPRVSLPVPRSVGMTTLHDIARAEIDTEKSPDVNQITNQLREFAPPDMNIHCVSIQDSSRLQRPSAVEWTFDVHPNDQTMIGGAIEQILSGSVVIKRWSKKRNREILIEPPALIRKLEFTAPTVSASVIYGNDGSIKPAELISMLGLAKELYLSKLIRNNIVWN